MNRALHGDDDRPQIVLVGASVRALAFATIRAGWSPWCADLFADSDLQAHAACFRISACDYPYAIPDILAKSAPMAPVMYTGKLENHPQVLIRLAARSLLWGNNAAVVREVRDPQRLQTTLAALDLPFASWSRTADGIPTDGTWVIKTMRGVSRWRGQSLSARPLYWQRYVPGEPASAVYIADGESCVWLGATWQLIGRPWCHARRFQWCGNVGPMPCSPRLAESLRRLGVGLTQQFGLRGVFGVDFVLHDDVPWVTEVNPRYPASLEVLELAKTRDWFLMHQAVFTEGHLPNHVAADEHGFLVEQFVGHHVDKPSRFGTSEGRFVGKAVLYAPKVLRFSLKLVEGLAPVLMPHTYWFDLALADLPNEDAIIPSGAPVLSVLAQHDSLDGLTSRLQSAASEIYSLLGVSGERQPWHEH